jgi:hypothetical protein
MNLNRQNTRGRGFVNNRAAPSVRNQVAMLKSSLHGHSNRLAGTNPPQLNRNPYNTITVTEDFDGSDDGGSPTVVTRSVASIVSKLSDQTGLVGKLRIKIQRIDVWATPAASTTTGDQTFQQTPQVAAKYYSLINGIVNNSGTGGTGFKVGLKELEDKGLSGQTAAKVSYSYPRDQADMPLGDGDISGTSAPVVDIAVGLGLVATVRYHLHWSSIGISSTFQ